jgi:hypothetical protein
MAEHLWSVLCSRVVIDKETNQASLLGTMEGLTVVLAAPLPKGEGRPLLVPYSMDLVSLWERSERDKAETATLRVRLTAPDGTVLGGDQEHRIDLSGGTRFRSVVRVESFLLADAGVFHFTVSLQKKRWVRVARLPLEVEIIVNQPPKA